VTAMVVELGFEVTGAFGIFGATKLAPPPVFDQFELPTAFVANTLLQTTLPTTRL